MKFQLKRFQIFQQDFDNLFQLLVFGFRELLSLLVVASVDLDIVAM